VSTDSLRDLVLALRQLHRHAGEPSTRDIAKAINYSHTTVAKAMNGDRCPSWPVLRAIVRGLHGDEDRFRELWVAVRDTEAPLSQDGAPILIFSQHQSGDSATAASAAVGVHASSLPMHEAYSNAEFIEQSGVPTTMRTGQAAVALITMKNTGTTVWSTASAFHLGSQGPHDNELWLPTGGNRVLLPVLSVLPGQLVTFTFPVHAPKKPGDYTFQWRMVQENVTWFGERTSPVEINISLPICRMWLADSY
jgi:Ig-like domain from next to BRCA1 gene/Helix-turn-helix domain